MPVSKKLTLAVLSACLLFWGCGPLASLLPLYSKAALTMDDAFAGRWRMVRTESDKKQESLCCMIIEKQGDAYEMTFPDFDEHQTLRSTLHLVKLGDSLFVDFEPADVKYARSTEVGFPKVEAHIFGRIWIEKDSLRFALLADDWLNALVKTGKPSSLPYVEKDGGLVLTATTEQLQTFAREHAEDKEAFSDIYQFQRELVAPRSRPRR
jgi:hypothetical protein